MFELDKVKLLCPRGMAYMCGPSTSNWHLSQSIDPYELGSSADLVIVNDMVDDDMSTPKEFMEKIDECKRNEIPMILVCHNTNGSHWKAWSAKVLETFSFYKKVKVLPYREEFRGPAIFCLGIPVLPSTYLCTVDSLEEYLNFVAIPKHTVIDELHIRRANSSYKVMEQNEKTNTVIYSSPARVESFIEELRKVAFIMGMSKTVVCGSVPTSKCEKNQTLEWTAIEALLQGKKVRASDQFKSELAVAQEIGIRTVVGDNNLIDQIKSGEDFGFDSSLLLRR